MIRTKRLFTREEPSREAKSIFIFCEGLKREYEYFKYFKEMDSRINIEIYKLHPSENNSPSGLLDIAKKCILVTGENPTPKYDFVKNDEVWIVIDTDKDKLDSRKPQILKIYEYCKSNSDWHVAHSNPCFEVWLYYHFYFEIPELKSNEKCSSWKSLVNSSINGGFNPTNHPIYIQTAEKNSEKNYSLSLGEEPMVGNTNVFKLAKSIISLVKPKLDNVLNNM